MSTFPTSCSFSPPESDRTAGVMGSCEDKPIGRMTLPTFLFLAKNKMGVRASMPAFFAIARGLAVGVLIVLFFTLYSSGPSCSQELGLPRKGLADANGLAGENGVAAVGGLAGVNKLPEKTADLPGCILMMDHRFGWNEDDFEGSKDGPSGAFEKWGREIEYHRPSRFVNWMYAMRHGYRFASGNATMYKKDRHPSWLKVAYMRDQLKCCCKWAMMIDSDSYVRLESHKMRVEDWVMQVMKEDKESENVRTKQLVVPGDPSSFFSGEERDDAIEMIMARNGNEKGGFQGEPDAFDRIQEKDVLCAGTFLLRRSKKAIQLLEDWFSYDGPTLFEHAWEQTPFNRLVYPKYEKNVAVFPFTEIGPNGRAVNHVWGADNTLDERNEMVRAAALGVIRSLPTWVLENIQERVDGPNARPSTPDPEVERQAPPL
ncbi:hypothetical protein KFL_001750200 [Klebsormidium nitens]|uniref:Uncharacterized protein n=1 Tax=Klebsormidium nitens TaxID=105231 RepID=A0A1Y1I0V1_KLENI|nr:hypothetical protein KFL_001750200 [Klebsormidium nitens]|eukprot:GAQ84083.1 hypothetical protein KFL_001750200 [Klebsormidium nitens]